MAATVNVGLTLRKRLVGKIIRHGSECWCDAEYDLSERIESALAPDRYAPLT
jgi:hypothetical protein